MRYLREIAGVAAAVATVLGTMTTAAFGSGSATNYVALGDSYSSGTGTRDYFDDSGACQRGPKAYPQLLADSHDVAQFAFDACAGAKTDDLNSKQLGSLDPSTSLVTLSIGGNDVGFAATVTQCLLGADSVCDRAVQAGETKARDELPAKLDATYGKIASAAPNAKVVVVGYPHVNELGDCGIPGYSETKRERINKGADVLAGVIEDRANAAGFTFADPRGRFEGHGVCGDQAWINGPSAPLTESFHPNVDGQAKGYLPVLDAVTS